MNNDNFNTQPDDNRWFEDLMRKAKLESEPETDIPPVPQPDDSILDEDWEKILQDAYEEELEIPSTAVTPEPAVTQAPESFQEEDDAVIRKVRPKRKTATACLVCPIWRPPLFGLCLPLPSVFP